MSQKIAYGRVGLGALFALLLFGQHYAQAQEHHGLSIASPPDGATVTGPLTVALASAEQQGQEGEHHHHGNGGGSRQVFLLIDQPAPAPGATIQADQTHIPFPEGQRQVTVTLPPGRHTLQLAVLDREGEIGRRFRAADPVTVTVQ